MNSSVYESSLLLVDPSAMLNLSSACPNHQILLCLQVEMAIGNPGPAWRVYRVYTAFKLIPRGAIASHDALKGFNLSGPGGRTHV